MSVSYHLDHDVVWITAEGDYQSEVFLETVRAGLADPAATDPAYLLCDVSRSDSLVDRSRDEVRASAEFYGTLLDRISGLAIVADRLVNCGLMRMLASLAEVRGCRVEVFRDNGSAREWLSNLAATSDPSFSR